MEGYKFKKWGLAVEGGVKAGQASNHKQQLAPEPTTSINTMTSTLLLTSSPSQQILGYTKPPSPCLGGPETTPSCAVSILNPHPSRPAKSNAKDGTVDASSNGLSRPSWHQCSSSHLRLLMRREGGMMDRRVRIGVWGVVNSFLRLGMRRGNEGNWRSVETKKFKFFVF